MDNQYFVGWGTLALINAGLAQGKNRTGLNWFLLSLVLGPVATFNKNFFEPYFPGIFLINSHNRKNNPI